ncbi:MAG: hypothetical protein WAM14_13250 [Candidatus Nitrosopolaris sp.]
MVDGASLIEKYCDIYVRRAKMERKREGESYTSCRSYNIPGVKNAWG